MSDLSTPSLGAHAARSDAAATAGRKVVITSSPEQAEADEIAVALAAVLAYLSAQEDGELPISAASRWARAGRLESQGIGVTDRSIRREWSV